VSYQRIVIVRNHTALFRGFFILWY